MNFDDRTTVLTLLWANRIAWCLLIPFTPRWMHAIGVACIVITVIANYVQRRGHDRFWDTYHTWMIRSFWWSLAAVGFGVVADLAIGGEFGLILLWSSYLAAWLWYLHRQTRGLIKLNVIDPASEFIFPG